MAKKKEAAVPKKAVKKTAKTANPKKKAAKTPVKSTKASPKSKEKLSKAVKAVKTPAKKSAKKTASPPKKAPKIPSIKNETQLLADAAVEGILEVKGRNISILNLTGIHNRVCDYFIICQADSTTQVQAIAGSVEEMVKKRTGERPYRSEGFENSEWILVDFVTVVVHIFQTQIRNFYNLESLWADAEVTEVAFDNY